MQPSAFLLILTLPFALSSFQERVITINQNGSDVEQCLGGLKPCLSLGFAARNANRSVHFQVDGEVLLQERVVFHSTINITIVGVNQSGLVCQNCTTCGLEFVDTQLIALQNITITGCGIARNLSAQGIPYQSAVILHNCSDIRLSHVTVQKCQGYGVVLTNSSGEIIVSKSYFLNNSIPSSSSLGGAGMRIIVSSCDIHAAGCNTTSHTSGRYQITESVFSDNSLGNITAAKIFHPWSLYYGSGLGILMWWGAQDNSINIYNSTFSGNEGPCGAGLSVECNMDSTNNNFHIYGCNFTDNIESHKFLGGAGVAVGTASNNYQSFPIDNIFSFEQCHFLHNMGYFGAGTLVYSAAARNISIIDTNLLTFTDCTWEHNSGVVSPAVDIEPDFYGTFGSSFILNVSFSSCKFLSNIINSFLPNRKYQYHAALGVLLITRLKVYFHGETLFKNNEGTALMLFSAHAEFGDGAVTTFSNNTGGLGGALVLFEFASLRYWNNTCFNFTNNRASFMGGAIYAIKNSQHEHFSSHACFMGYADPAFNPQDSINVSIYFKDNIAKSGFANSIFMSTVEPCQYSCMTDNGDKPSPQETFNQSCLGHFHFFDDLHMQIGTLGSNLQVTLHPPYKIIPGRDSQVPVNITDEFGNNAANITEFQLSVYSENASVASESMFVTNNTVMLAGNPGSEGNLTLIGIRSNAGISVPFQLEPCAPGFVTSRYPSKCVCSSIVDDSRYQGVVSCNDSAGIAYISPAMWVGYVTDKANENNLFTGFCVHGYCRDFGVSVNISKPYKLLDYASKEDLEQLVCSDNRQGILCGKCSHGHSVYYHSWSFTCGPNSLCNLGPLFYLLSELLPTTILFMIIIFFDISLTSGFAYSITFMLQMLQAMGVTLISGSPYQDLSTQIALMIYSTLNLEFFSFEKLSFCLWAGASALDILVMKYVTILFAGGLVFCTIFIINYCNCGRLTRCLHCRNRPHSFVQGLTAFLVICYSQCTLVAFYVLNPTTLTGKGGQEYKTSIVYFDGNISYFSTQHLPYAIPSLLVLAIIVIPLPVILFGDPFFLKLEYLINRCFCSTRNRYPYTMFRQKFKPLFDSFQGCFKDEYRFTSGLFFIYRIIFLLAFVISPRLDWFYGIIGFILLIIMTIQALMQPFQESKHNTMTVLVFFNLTLLNCCSVMIYLLLYGSVHTSAVYFFQWFQLVLLYLPIVCGLCWCAWKVFQWFYLKTNYCGYFRLNDDFQQSGVVPLDHD